MIILGLTGSVGMGKSEAARMFHGLGVPVFDADAAVHDVLAQGGEAVAAVAAQFPGVLKDGAIDRQKLGAEVFGKPEDLKRLENILHPVVSRRRKAFLKDAARRREPLVVLDIPLLFETGGEMMCDAVAVVSAPPFVQRQRVFKRPGMTEKRFNDILAQQVPDGEKRQMADFVIPTGLGKAETLKHIIRIARVLSRRERPAAKGKRPGMRQDADDA